ncbi:hypothetical protein BN77_p10439 [Rhizobium mesoamericanum STM3625]|uniref:Uncharacterized protein n=1 Tax=Rhizobium mesoamericanum STM3625 TaxID=1211777 RepID=K0PYW4_9HYPH|nr:hypothetical protein BN77_p10439 [Rhizobium mesoamericanum STM3625]
MFAMQMFGTKFASGDFDVDTLGHAISICIVKSGPQKFAVRDKIGNSAPLPEQKLEREDNHDRTFTA